MMGWHSALLLYSSCSSLVIIILSVLYSHCGTSDRDSEKTEFVNGNLNKISKTETDVALISIDNSKDFLSSEPQDCECGGIINLEWTILEILIVGIIGLGILIGIIKAAFHFKSLIQEKLEKVRNERSLKIRNQIEAMLADRSADRTAEEPSNQLCRTKRREEPEPGPDMVLTYR